MANKLRERLSKPTESVFVPDPLDPETGQVVKAVTLADDPEDDGAKVSRPARKLIGPITPTAGPVLVYRRDEGVYYRAGKFPGRPTDDEILERYPQGGAFRFEQTDRAGAVIGREYREIAGFDAPASSASAAGDGFGWVGAPKTPAAPSSSSPSSSAPPQYVIQAPAPAPGPDLLKILTVAGPLALQAMQLFGSSLREGIAQSVRAALPPPAPPQQDPMAQLTGLASALRSLQDAGIVRLGVEPSGEGGELEGYAGFASMVAKLLEARGASPLAVAGAAVSPPQAPPSLPSPGPVPATEEAARAELEVVARGLNMPLEAVRGFLLSNWLKRDNATWRELAAAGREYAAAQGFGR